MRLFVVLAAAAGLTACAGIQDSAEAHRDPSDRYDNWACDPPKVITADTYRTEEQDEAQQLQDLKTSKVAPKPRGTNEAIYFLVFSSYFRAMLKFRVFLLAILSIATSACTGSNALNFGTLPDATDNGSYTGSTLNSPVADQNPHPGGDPSYPSSVSDQGVVPPPPEKSDGR